MRVIGGEARGRRLVAPQLPGLRPTSDRVREAIFDILEARDLVVGTSVLDLFAGSGALGIEALSRGAASCIFVDNDRRAIAAIEHNLEAVGLSGRVGVRVVRAEALSYLTAAAGVVGLGLIDPPYRFEAWGELLGGLRAELAVLEHGSPLEVSAGFQTIRRYRYGGTLVTLVARQAADKDKDEDPA
ncbi:MAG: 16S rRNA (guanine(966)-N(2))-methyltransferase RsmD [Acidimicrobiales bacterium]